VSLLFIWSRDVDEEGRAVILASTEVSTNIREEIVDLECDGKRQATVARSMQFVGRVMTLALRPPYVETLRNKSDDKTYERLLERPSEEKNEYPPHDNDVVDR